MFLAALLSTATTMASELEVIVYDDSSSTLLLEEQYEDPESLAWPKSYSILTSGSVVVSKTTAPSGKVSFCIDYRSTSVAPWNQTCVEAEEEDDLVYGVSWKDQALAVGFYLNTYPGFDSGWFLDYTSFPSATSSCSIACDDGTACASSCNGNCKAVCDPGAQCGCL